MFREDEVELWLKGSTVSTDDYGTRSKGEPTYYKTIMCTVQPYSRDLLLKKYGYDIIVSKIIYCDVDEDIKENSLLKYDNEFYEVKKILEWKQHYEVVVDICPLKLNSMG